MNKTVVNAGRKRMRLLVTALALACTTLVILPVYARQKMVEVEKPTAGVSGQLGLEAEVGVVDKVVTMSGVVNGLRVMETSDDTWCDAWLNIQYSTDSMGPTVCIISTKNQKMQPLLSLAWDKQEVLWVSGYQVPSPPDRDWLPRDEPYYVITELKVSGPP